MSSDTDGFDKRARGDRAKNLLDDPVFQDAMETIRSNIHSHWESLAIDDSDTLYRLKVAIHTLNSIERQLQNYVEEKEVDILQEEYENKYKESKKWLT
jgi:hypothetical protein